MSDAGTAARYESDWRLLLTEADRARMLDDIGRVALAVGRRQFPGRDWEDLDVTAGSWAARRSPAERLWFVESLLPRLIPSLKHIERTPSVTLVTEARRTSPWRARRVTTASVLRAARRGEAGASLEEQTAAPTVDTPENRAVKAFLRRLAHDLRVIGAAADAAGEGAMARAARRCRHQIAPPLAAPWLNAVRDAPAAWQAPPTRRMHILPAYAAVSEAMRQYRTSFAFDWAHPAFTLPARESWRLYETWCLFRALEALLALGWVPQPPASASSPLRVREDRLTFALAKGEESRLVLRSPEGRALSLAYNPTYPQASRSLSRTMQPDVALEQGTPEGAVTWVLDAKFKRYAAPGAEGDDMDQMHAYRDAILNAQGKKSVRRAWCLYPGQVDGPNRALIAYGPPAGSVVGALCLRPGDAPGFERLCHLLAAWLGSVSSPPQP